MKKGFTLIELIVVIAIIAILAAIIAPNAFKAIEKAKISKAVADMKTIKTGVLTFYADTGGYPDRTSWVKDSGLMKNEDTGGNPFSGWDGSYLEKSPDPHPWSGTYWLDPHWDLAKGSNAEFIILWNDACHKDYPNHIEGCGIPASVQQKIDEILDDGNLSDGDVSDAPRRRRPDRNFLDYIFTWDFQPCTSGSPWCD